MPSEDPEQLMLTRYRLLRHECARVTAEIANGLAEYFNMPVVMKPNFEVRLELMIWRSLALRNHLSIQESIFCLCDYYTHFRPKVISAKRIAGVSPISYRFLTGKCVWNAMPKAVAFRYPDNEHLLSFRQQQLTKVADNSVLAITYSDPREFVADYRNSMQDHRHSTPYTSDKPFRFSPWK